MKTCCVTGHRTLPEDQIPNIKQRLEQEIRTAIEDGYSCFITGMAEGADLLFAEIVVNLREDHPGLFLEAALPYYHKTTGRSKQFLGLLRQCNGIACGSQSYHPGVYFKRNRSMVQSAKRVIAVYDGRETGGTLFSMRYAHALEKDIRLIYIESKGADL